MSDFKPNGIFPSTYSIVKLHIETCEEMLYKMRNTWQYEENHPDLIKWRMRLEKLYVKKAEILKNK